MNDKEYTMYACELEIISVSYFQGLPNQFNHILGHIIILNCLQIILLNIPLSFHCLEIMSASCFR